MTAGRLLAVPLLGVALTACAQHAGAAPVQHPGKPAVSTRAVCRGPVPLVTVALGPAPAGYQHVAADVTIGTPDGELAEILADSLGGLYPDGAVSSTVDGPSPVPVTIIWPDGGITRRSVPTPHCPTAGRR
jgi:hypothetical protein